MTCQEARRGNHRLFLRGAHVNFVERAEKPLGLEPLRLPGLKVLSDFCMVTAERSSSNNR